MEKLIEFIYNFFQSIADNLFAGGVDNGKPTRRENNLQNVQRQRIRRKENL